MPSIGYTHSLFTGNLRKYAEKVDHDTKNGGNNNGIIDGKEILAFKNLVKQKTGYDFDFTKIKQSEAKTVDIKNSDGSFKYSTSTQLAEKYRKNGASSKSINALSGGDPFSKNSNKTAVVPYMSENDFNSSAQEVERQEAIVSKAIRERKEAKREAELKELHRNCKSDFEKLMDILF